MNEQHSAEKDAHLKVLAAAVCSTDACPMNHKPGQFCFRGWDAARAVVVNAQHSADKDALLDLIEREYEAFRHHHAEAQTRESPEGFARLFRAWMARVLPPEGGKS